MEIEELLEQELRNKENDIYNSAFYLNLKENYFIPKRISEFVEDKFGDRFKANNDYRQMMLSYVLSCVDKYERERMVQMLLPERVILHLKNHSELMCEFHEQRNGQRLCHRLFIKRLGLSSEHAFMGIAGGIEELSAKMQYRIGSNGVLLVGDNSNPSLHLILNEKFHVLNPEGAQAAITYLKQQFEEISLIISDDSLKTEDVKKVLDYRNEYLPQTPFIYTTKDDNLLEFGATDFVLFPYKKDAILNRVNHYIQYRDSLELLKIVERDSLTGFYTKEFFYRKAHERMGTLNQYCIIRIVLENLQLHIEKYGEVVSDMIVGYLVNQIKKTFTDLLVTGRLSEDDFTILVKSVTDEQLSEFTYNMKHNAPVSNLIIKVGVVSDSKEGSIETLCNHAQIAISKIKQVYDVDFIRYSSEMKIEKEKEQLILSNMEKALEQNQFKILYQPKHRCGDEMIGGAEALVRWEMPGIGLIRPDEFIPLFEKTGFIRGLDNYVFFQVCRDIICWKTFGIPVVPISINLSRRDFESDGIVEQIIHLTNQMNIDHELIHFEVTESAFTDDPQRVSKGIEQLHNEGFMIELDDFGTGYSSLEALNSLDLDIIKIDKSIVQKKNKITKRNVLKFCLQLSKVMNLKTVAEGVETEEQFNRLKQLGCDYVQGFYYSKPLTADEFEKYLIEHNV